MHGVRFPFSADVSILQVRDQETEGWLLRSVAQLVHTIGVDLMRLRVTERPWDIQRRRYAVERLTIDLPDFQGWSIERFFDKPLDAQLFMASFSNGPRVISERVIPPDGERK
jgi:hypothetical protein